MIDEIGFRLLQLAGRGYCCSQVLIILALEAQGKTNPDLVRAMSGLCMGGAGSGNACGVFTGAACILALYAAKGEDSEKENEKLPLMYSELSEWFEQTACASYNGVLCKDIIGEEASVPDSNICGRLLTDTYNQVMEILVQNGFDPSDPCSYED
ncbi:MAG: C_GCAxxG_C_C family protein [Desulfobacterium sp.]|nr:C_GCAxxG_C_C family protein [Desulfobacterium sp.]MBU3947710.1 C-GCAxxG-C-C family protein [Pseudomonadota bacterium]MBU4009330.1 C-GCAxxG-C-C family protein [Pseudomonadota bacterium]MBU4035051.1 C-GCAxxG-C-C family protein [Pseudomonadota bacterium]